VSLEWEVSYSNLVTNSTLAELYQANVKTLGITFGPLKDGEALGSTDMGNVSYIVPSTHVMYGIDSKAVNHSHAFTTAAITEIAHEKTLIASKGMAMTAIDVLCNPELMVKIKKDFEEEQLKTDS